MNQKTNRECRQSCPTIKVVCEAMMKAIFIFEIHNSIESCMETKDVVMCNM